MLQLQVYLLPIFSWTLYPDPWRFKGCQEDIASSLPQWEWSMQLQAYTFLGQDQTLLPASMLLGHVPCF